ncbi:MAG TPA: Crp/Fnr family transcriptional regulator [Gemmataceae bacterium]|nr:Crp/Fnr family transcriptional regulator [Gemmataceae bacterium]
MAVVSEVKENQLLAALPRREFERLRERLEPVYLPFGQVLVEPNEPIPYVFFPRQGILSLVAVMDDGDTSEVGMVGNEGMAGLSVFLGGDQAITRVLVRAPGDSWRLKSKVFKEVVRDSSALQDILSRYTQALLSLISQTTACNLLHPAQARLRRWLLMAQDRIGADEFHMTQEFIAGLLGVSRPTVSIVAGGIQRAGHIRYRRGKIRILDRAALESECCPCYNVMRHEYQRLLEGAQSRSRAKA